MTNLDKAKLKLLKEYKDYGFIIFDDIIDISSEYDVDDTDLLVSFLEQRGIKIYESSEAAEDDGHVVLWESMEDRFDSLKKILLIRAKANSNIMPTSEIFGLADEFELDLTDDQVEDLVSFVKNNSIRIIDDLEDDDLEDDEFDDEEEEIQEKIEDKTETDDEETSEEEMNKISPIYDSINNLNAHDILKNIIESKCLINGDGQYYCLKLLDIGYYYEPLGESYENKAFLIVSFDTNTKKYKIGLSIGNGDEPVNPFPTYLSEKDSLKFSILFCSNQKCKKTFKLEKGYAYEYSRLSKLISDKYSPQIKDIHGYYDDGVEYSDCIIPEELEVYNGITQEDCDGQRLKELGYSFNGTSASIFCDLGSNAGELNKDKTTIKLLRCLILLGYNK